VITLQLIDCGVPTSLPNRELPQSGAVGQLFGPGKTGSTCLCEWKLGERLPLNVSPIFPGVSSSDFLYVGFRDLLGFLQFGEDSKFRADETAKTAFHAVFGLEDQFRRVIALGIKALALLQALVRTKFDAKPAAFAPIFYNVNSAVRYRMGLSIQW
jgi:hypothetical protein